MSAHDPQDPQPTPTFRDLLAAAEAARRISTPPPATPPQRPRPTVPDKDAA
ncbi:hypothetical protein [Actinacidiphila bryophytorum]|uniref:Uncharacterized protein n=1 Tax=Actinacidiphila bryophytorum TaxID=1436133 RepID=A0A9W4GVY2_9ACTN|nr:hypothetical protein [Actinacidiphila bryophytorum]MBM9436577.1 hypothetical protein [Actinacidiphila bryophytorum]CAG7599870.1 conserved hypothetical protein [Actinacidiphila bryophytorum]